MNILKASPNRFSGIVPDPQALPSAPEIFSAQLAASLQHWTVENYQVVWLEIPITQSHLIPLAVAAGFSFHHSGADYLMLTYCLVPGAYVPPYATHYIGAGGVVLNAKRELLVIWEKAHKLRGHRYYKLPGGALLQGEHLVDGVMREVYEETGIRTQFESLMCFRHWHGYRYGKSDIYFICRLSPLNADIVIQESEIEQCLWMPVEDYLAHEFVGVFNKRVVEVALTGQGLVPTWFDAYAVDPDSREIFVAQQT